MMTREEKIHIIACNTVDRLNQSDLIEYTLLYLKNELEKLNDDELEDEYILYHGEND
jgi:hypothetical protein